jgi:outer membrane receptor protein involved in Fe transport
VTTHALADAPVSTSPSERAVPAEPIEITVRGNKQSDTFSSTRAASTVTEQNVRDSSPGSLADTLRGQVGVSIQQTTPGQGTIYLRGLAGREIVHLVDGVRLNSALFRSPNNPILSTLDPFSFRSVEVIRGPSSVLHGSDAMGGVISMATPLPGYSIGGATTRIMTFQGVTSNPVGSQSRIAARHSEKDWAAHLGLTYVGSGDVVPGGSMLTPAPSSYVGLERAPGASYLPLMIDVQRGTSFQRLSADGSIRFRLAPRLEAVLRGQLSERPSLVRYDEVTPRFAPAPSKPARAEATLGPLLRAMTSATLVHRPGRGAYDSGLLTLAWQRLAEEQLRRDLDETCVTGEKASSCTSRLRLDPAPTRRTERSQVDAFSVRAEARFLNANRTLGATIGGEGTHEIVTSSAARVAAASGASEAAEPRYPAGATMSQAGLFGQFEVWWLPNLRGHIGGRASAFAINIPGRPGVAPLLGGAGVSNALFDGALTMGLSWQVTRGLSWVANAGRGVRAPNIDDYAGLGARAGGRFQVPNPTLKPEHTHAVDTGIKIARGPLQAETYVFFTHFSDAIGLAKTTVDGQPSDPSGAAYVRGENVSRLDLYGVESDIRIGPPQKGGVFARGSATQFSESTASISAAERVLPPIQGTAGFWVLPVPKLRVEVFANGRASQRRVLRVDDTRIAPGGTEGFVTFHARAVYKLSAQVTARVSLDNITNALALEHGSGFYLPGFSGTASIEGTLSR